MNQKGSQEGVGQYTKPINPWRQLQRPKQKRGAPALPAAATLLAHTCTHTHARARTHTQKPIHLQGNGLATAGIICSIRGSRDRWGNLGEGCRYFAVILGIPKEEIDDCRLGSGTEGTESLGGTTEGTVRVRASPCCCSPSLCPRPCK